MLLDLELLNLYKANSKYEWVLFCGPEQVWLTYAENLTNSNQIRTLVSFCESGAVRKCQFWIIYGWLYSTFYGDKRILWKCLVTFQLREFV